MRRDRDEGGDPDAGGVVTRRRVAVTGLGALTPLGHDVATTWAGLRAGASGIRPLRLVPDPDTSVRLTVGSAAEVQDYDPATHFEARRLVMLDRVAQFALVAAREALRDVDPACLSSDRAGVILAAAMGLESHDMASKAIYAEGASRLHPMTVPRIMPSGPASHVSMEFGMRGPSFAVASACASSNHAITVAFQMVRAGLLDVAVTGGADCPINTGFIKAWEALRVLSPETCRPFSRDRAGLVIGEGAGVLVLEEWEHATRRGAPILAELLGCGMSADAGDLTSPSADGAARAMRAALTDAGLTPAEIDYVNAHGTGTRLNDSTESDALARVFGDRLPDLPVSSSKSMFGHCMNASGALEAVATVLALRDGVLPPTIGFREPDPECPVDCVPNEARAVPITTALSNSFAFGGLNAVIALRRAA